MRGITLRQLRALAETVRQGSVTAAAKGLNVTAPAVSLQLRLLQELAGMPLIEKKEAGFRPTPAGAALIDAAHRIEAILRDAGETLSSIREGDRGTVHVGVVSTAKYFAPRLLAAFRHAHPGIDIKLSVGNREETVEALSAYDVDVAFMGRPPRHFDVVRQEIGPHPHVVIAPPGHRLARGQMVSLAALAEETFLVRESGSGTRSLTDQFFSTLGRVPPIGMEITSNETIKQAVMAGLGIAVISAHTVSVELQEARLALIQCEGVPILRSWFLVRRGDRQLTPAARRLWQFVADDGPRYLPAPS
jgi:LysR family transcriptional regulator for metE and metH